MREGGSASGRIATTLSDAVLFITRQFWALGFWRRSERPGGLCLRPVPRSRQFSPRTSPGSGGQLFQSGPRTLSGVLNVYVWLWRSANRTVRDRGLAHVQIRRCWRRCQREERQSQGLHRSFTRHSESGSLDAATDLQPPGAEEPSAQGPIHQRGGPDAGCYSRRRDCLSNRSEPAFTGHRDGDPPHRHEAGGSFPDRSPQRGLVSKHAPQPMGQNKGSQARGSAR
jgi:hypothetical protein